MDAAKCHRQSGFLVGLSLAFGTLILILVMWRFFAGAGTHHDALVRTGRDLDIAIVGHGFFQIDATAGKILYTRVGNFSVNKWEEVCVFRSGPRSLWPITFEKCMQLLKGRRIDPALGMLLEPAIALSGDRERIVITRDGYLLISQGDQPSDLSKRGSIQLVRFPNPDGLRYEGDGLYSETNLSGQPITGDPGTDGFGILQQGWLEKRVSEFAPPAFAFVVLVALGSAVTALHVAQLRRLRS